MPEDQQKDDSGSNRSRFPTPPKVGWIWLVLAGLLVVNIVVSNALLQPEEPIRISYTEFVSQIENGNVESVTSTV